MMQDHFRDLSDTRQPGKIRHNLLEIVVMTICAVIAGCDVWEDIVDFCRVKENWFKNSLHMKLENGLPSHDTFQRVWGMIEPEEFEKCFCSWVNSVCSVKENDIISVDGKTVRGSGGNGKSPIHMVSAWANQSQLVLGQIATEEKSNEITAVPKLLECLDIKGCIVTADAMSCQKEITKTAVNKGADYAIGLKDNQPNLRRDTAAYFLDALADPKNYPEIQSTETKEKGHGRIESRKYYLTTSLNWLDDKMSWGNLNGLGMVRSKVEKNGEISEETRYYITSLTDVDIFAKAVRAHWGVENSLHWCLDMTFHEDHSRIRKDHSAENMAVVRHLALDILKHYPEKISLARKRRRCSYDDAFLAGVLQSVHA
jgi:predicted transposase YbfD/YdcC